MAQKFKTVSTQSARSARRGSWLIPAAFATVIGALIVAAVYGVMSAEHTKERDKTTRAAAGAVAPPPWPLPTDTPTRIESAGLSLGPMGTADHYHAHLAVVVDGKSVPVPSDIGVDRTSGQMSAVHTHSADGIVHVEAHTRGEKFTLGQLFAQWNVRLTPTQIGSLKDGQDKRLAAYVDGKRFTGNPASIVLKNKRDIALVYGVPDEIEPPKPFVFPKNI